LSPCPAKTFITAQSIYKKIERLPLLAGLRSMVNNLFNIVEILNT